MTEVTFIVKAECVLLVTHWIHSIKFSRYERRSVNRLILQSLSNTVRRFQWRHPPRLPNWRQQTYRNLSSYFKFLVGGGTIYCLSGVALTVNAAEANPLHSSQYKLGKKEEERAIAEADSLFSLYQVDRLYEFLKKFEHTTARSFVGDLPGLLVIKQRIAIRNRRKEETDVRRIPTCKEEFGVV
ncbi:hypothetical protein EB796_024477 [Bugula neritina]|uniref:Uncharacterized protein n=1 Tax=Bugula neritina TaxID=10212 RepID=A0A7J7ITG2_BUGNE|nr:hypothetical protein EB796_024477 [Bugula neritina]